MYGIGELKCNSWALLESLVSYAGLSLIRFDGFNNLISALWCIQSYIKAVFYKNSSVKYSTVKYSTVKYSTVKYSTVE